MLRDGLKDEPKTRKTWLHYHFKFSPIKLVGIHWNNKVCFLRSRWNYSDRLIRLSDDERRKKSQFPRGRFLTFYPLQNCESICLKVGKKARKEQREFSE